MDEQQRRRVLTRLEKIDAVALARAISEIEMGGLVLAHLAGTLLPAGDHFDASGYRCAVVEAEVAFLLAHLAPVHIGEIRHVKNLRQQLQRYFHSAGKWSTALPCPRRNGTGEK
jgi:hypothetical protein